MAITQAMCTSFKVQLLKGQHNFTNGAHIFRLALFQEAATLGAATSNYTTANEAASGGTTNYTAGGNPLTNVTPSDGGAGTTAFTSFSTLTFPSSTITAAGALIYNTQTNGGSGTTDSVVVLNFGGNKSSTSGDFSIVFPTANANDAIIRIQ
jgi:hypothetical protein|tara:strand:- start:55 stop:510 length:456 start_codon:yes stop_codon:yes gene_type:complete